ncbi:nuclear transport factor 2 family protein, partial [Streptomyces sp. NPDC024062]|uniref:nuclear transport factor 2 family protein n=1 Tax=Streptomyces sp. NPDC024062 TaxID=3156646 RepID=UPI00345611D6
MPHTGTAPLDPARPGTAGLHGEITHFYARQMQALDDGRTDDWARTFTEDGVFLLHGGHDRAEMPLMVTENGAAFDDYVSPE